MATSKNVQVERFEATGHVPIIVQSRRVTDGLLSAVNAQYQIKMLMNTEVITKMMI